MEKIPIPIQKQAFLMHCQKFKEFDIRLIFLDLDGTLLNSKKELSLRNYRALEAAATNGIEIVPTTGRLLCALPKVIEQLPFVRYVVAVNGAVIFDRQAGSVLFRAEMPCETALSVLRRCDGLPAIYDCYAMDQGWMSEQMHDHVAQYACNIHQLRLLLEMRSRVPELKQFLSSKQVSVQKISLFFRETKVRDYWLEKLKSEYENLLFTSSYENNIEINSPFANKGAALKFLCDHLCFSQQQSMSFGDGSNDISMLHQAGIGVAMANGDATVHKAANLVAPTCDEDGVAQTMEALLPTLSLL